MDSENNQSRNSEFRKSLDQMLDSIGDKLVNFLIDKFMEMKLDGQFHLSQFFKSVEYTSSSPEYNLFNTSYHDTVLRIAEQRLYQKGYSCSLELENKTIFYNCRVISTRSRTIFLIFTLMTTIFSVYGAYAYQKYTNAKMNVAQNEQVLN